ncbi:MAG: exodeoxyribonuclease III [Synechococcus sp. SB0662_bin_45]|uniref:Exodeoxyribonuclease III n=1 Tax=Synechococcus sp. SB0676_bin_10 TaxID=2604869 RepID=A0A6B1FB11_9SYNE|nr:exodeoxyribonuclease III [Cyanobacteria bacterium MAG IRC1_bin_28]MDE0647025.1 exodeoxyribonuclease III [Cyanobacteria bacterium MAG IRC4_bin_6]MXW13257.1 exodeoxyribonuclease III [Synechococcus sp. SB0668_bin_13]MXX08825.1 exodeoxyribonuclease III [Synechococcus sp. SB0667_bin_8]MXY19591.1 exodeoxyribonuclease III [Synechococcus sp. SB0664_bin_36]MYE22070.1 exodeoxyribonuclease III [Synechococcus sp. SB0662_bin_45]MYG37502.1 exodeoxyribonuclease III [Synechococcus sp. SB0676_bin_10]MYG63
MRIATWNVNSLRARLGQVVNWLETHQPDVLCLQETKVADDLFPHGPLNAVGYSAATSGQKAYNGVALISREPLDDVRIGFDGLLEEDGEAVILSGQKRVISGRLGSLRILNVYVPNGASVGSRSYSYKLAWLECLGRYVAVQLEQGEPLCMAGDFNIAPEDRDLHDPQQFKGRIMASTQEREALQVVLGQDLKDVFRRFHPEGGHWSWWDYRGGSWRRNRGWRLDHVYLTQDLHDTARDCWIDRQQRGLPRPSDHAPVAVELFACAAADH